VSTVAIGMNRPPSSPCASASGVTGSSRRSAATESVVREPKQSSKRAKHAVRVRLATAGRALLPMHTAWVTVRWPLWLSLTRLRGTVDEAEAVGRG